MRQLAFCNELRATFCQPAFHITPLVPHATAEVWFGMAGGRRESGAAASRAGEEEAEGVFAPPIGGERPRDFVTRSVTTLLTGVMEPRTFVTRSVTTLLNGVMQPREFRERSAPAAREFRERSAADGRRRWVHAKSDIDVALTEHRWC